MIPFALSIVVPTALGFLSEEKVPGGYTHIYAYMYSYVFMIPFALFIVVPTALGFLPEEKVPGGYIYLCIYMYMYIHV